MRTSYSRIRKCLKCGLSYEFICLKGSSSDCPLCKKDDQVSSTVPDPTLPVPDPVPVPVSDPILDPVPAPVPDPDQDDDILKYGKRKRSRSAKRDEK